MSWRCDCWQLKTKDLQEQTTELINPEEPRIGGSGAAPSITKKGNAINHGGYDIPRCIR
jgi:hypothetical protein